MLQPCGAGMWNVTLVQSAVFKLWVSFLLLTSRIIIAYAQGRVRCNLIKLPGQSKPWSCSLVHENKYWYAQARGPRYIYIILYLLIVFTPYYIRQVGPRVLVVINRLGNVKKPPFQNLFKAELSPRVEQPQPHCLQRKKNHH